MSYEDVLQEFKLLAVNSNPWTTFFLSLPTLPVTLEAGERKFNFKALLSRESKDSFISMRASVALGLQNHPYILDADMSCDDMYTYYYGKKKDTTVIKENVILKSLHELEQMKTEPIPTTSSNSNESENNMDYIKACQVKVGVITLPYINIYEPVINWNDYANLWKHSAIEPTFESNNCCYYQDGGIDVVIGIEGLCMTGPLRTIPPRNRNFPTAEETRLGWLAHGPVPVEIACPGYVPPYPRRYLRN